MNYKTSKPCNNMNTRYDLIKTGLNSLMVKRIVLADRVRTRPWGEDDIDEELEKIDT